MARRRRPSQARSRRRSRAFAVEGLEGRRLLAANVAVASDVGPFSTPFVRLVDAETGAEQASVMAFESGFKGGVRLAMGHVTGNAAADIVAASGAGRVAEVKVFKPVTSGGTTTLTRVLSFKPFGDAYTGGCEVSVGDVDGDGTEDIVVSKSREGGDVKVFKVTNTGGTTTAALHATIARPFGPAFNGGSSVGVADVGEFTNGALVKSLADNKVEILVGSGAGMPAQVRVYDISQPATPRLADTINPAFNAAYGLPFRGGVTVTSGRYAASGVAASIDDIVVSAGRGGSGAAQTIVYDGTVAAAANTLLKGFATYGTGQRPTAPVFAAAVDVDGNGQVDRFLVTQGDPGGPAGIANVSIAGVRSATAVTSLAGPLRIAAPRTVFATQTVNATVSTPSPTAGVTAGSSQPMQIRDVVTGSGTTANVGNTLTVQYTGMLTGGTVFDTSRQTGRTAFTFTLGAGEVISGWETGLVGMKVGGRRILVIPPALAYGDTARTGIPAGSTLVFDVELVAVSGNSTASISGTSTGALTEDGGTTTGGTLTVTDPDAGQAVFATPASLNKTYGTFTFNATTGVWGYTLDNSRTATQSLAGGQTVTDSLPVTSSDGTASKTIVVTITGAPETPTDIALSAATVPENAASGTIVGTLSTTDADAGDTFTYTLVSGTGDANNASFTIAGAALKTAASFDFETKASYSIRVRSTDAGGLFTEKQFTVTVTNVNEAATIDGTATGSVTAGVGAMTADGTLTVTDADAGQAKFAAPTSASLIGRYGDFTFDADSGAWTYALDTSRPATLLLRSTDTVTDSLAVTSMDGTASRTIQVSITGFTLQTTPGVTRVVSGDIPVGSTRDLQYAEIVTGTGATATTGSTLTVNYLGMQTDGTVFNSWRTFGPILLGTTPLIAGWDYGLVGMQVGGQRLLVIPPELAYGDAGQFPTGDLANETLIFKVELLSVT